MAVFVEDLRPEERNRDRGSYKRGDDSPPDFVTQTSSLFHEICQECQVQVRFIIRISYNISRPYGQVRYNSNYTATLKFPFYRQLIEVATMHRRSQ